MNDNYSDLPQFTIHQLSVRLNIPKPTLRFWEKELEGIIVPLRTPGGQRRYTDEHIDIIRKVKYLRGMGKGITEIRDVLANRQHEKQDHKTSDIELLSERISEIVLKEVSNFLNNRGI